MAHSLESRVPFLDNDLVDFAQRVPVRLKLRDLEHVVALDENLPSPKNERYFERTRDGKLLLRQVMQRYVPEQVTNQVKQGFSGPDASWFRGDSIDYVRQVVHNDDSAMYEYLNPTVVRRLVDDHLEGRENRRLLLWSLLTVEHWCQTFLNGSAAVRLVITGATGFVGRHLVADLAAAPRGGARWRGPLPPTGGTVRVGRAGSASAAGRRAAAAPHRWCRSTSPSLRDTRISRRAPRTSSRSTWLSTFQLLEWACAGRRADVRARFHGGPVRVLRASRRRGRCDRVDGFYFRSKHSAEVLLGAYRELLATVVLRPFFVYGEGQRRMLIARLAEQIVAGERDRRRRRSRAALQPRPRRRRRPRVRAGA